MSRFLFLLVVLLVVTASGCASYGGGIGPHTEQQELSAIDTATQQAVPAPITCATAKCDTAFDVEPSDGGLYPDMTGFMREIDRLPWGEARAPPEQTALFTLPWLGGTHGTPVPVPDGFWPLQTTLVPSWSAGSGIHTFTRNLAAYVQDFDGRLVSIPSGAARMAGTRIEQSVVATKSEDWTNGAWIKTIGTVTATTLTSTGANQTVLQTYTAASADYVMRVRMSRITGTGNIQLTLDGGTGWTTVTLTSSAQVFSISQNAVTNPQFGIRIVTSGDAINADQIAVYNTTGKTNTNPPEYVSVGVLSAPYHGLGVDGIKSFSTLNGNTVTSNVVTEATGAAISSSTAKFGVLTGGTGDYFSTPSAAANQITGDIDIRCLCMLTNWIPSASNTLVAKWLGAGNKYAYIFQVDTNGKLHLAWTTDGTAGTLQQGTASVTTGFANGTAHWVRATVLVNNGASGYDLKFWTGVETVPGTVTWTQNGTTVVGGATTSIFASSQPVWVGNNADNTAQVLTGNAYRAQIYNGINGTLAVDFNPNLSTSAQTFTAATGEVWTTNGNARIFGNTSSTYGIPTQWDAGGPFGYLAESSAQNVKIHSQDKSGWGAVNVTLSDNAAVAPDGTTTAISVIEAAGNASHQSTTSSITGVGVTVSASIWAKMTGRRYTTFGMTDSTTGGVYAYFDLQSGVISQAVVNGGEWTNGVASIEAWSNNWYRLNVTGTLGATRSGSIEFYLSNVGTGSETPTYNGDGTSGIYVWGAMIQVASLISSYTSTTTVAVTRPADVDQGVSSGNVSATATSLSQTLTPSTALGSTTVYHWATYVDANNWTAQWSDGTNLYCSKRINGTTHSASIAWTRTINVPVNTACRWDTTNGSDVWLSGTKGTNDATLTASQVGTNFQIGADGNGANQDNMEHRNLRIWISSISDTQAATQTADAYDWLMPYRVAWLKPQEAANR